MEFETFALSNGIRLVVQQEDSPISHACILVNAGSRNEAGGQFGLAHFIEHLLFKKTERRNTVQILNRLESVGADLNAYTTKEYTCLHASFLKPYLRRTLDLFEDLLFHSVFPEEELEKEKGIILDEMASYLDSPEDAIMDDFEDLVFKGHGLGHNILGIEKDLKLLDRTAIEEFIRNNYLASGIVIGISGNYPVRQILDTAEKLFGHIPHGLQMPSVPGNTGLVAGPPLETPIHVERIMPINQVHYVMGSRAYDIHHEKKTGLLLLNNLLGGMGMSSRLNMLVREKYGIAYTIESNYLTFTDTGLFCVYFGTDEDKYQKARKLVLQEFKKLRDHQLGTQALHQAKKKFKGQIALGEEGRLSLIIAQSKSVLDHGRTQTLEELFRKIDAVSQQEILEIANEILAEDQLFTLCFLP